jgi:hypothetical protein
MSSAEVLADALFELFRQTRDDGAARWTDEDVLAARSVLLLEVVRRGELEQLGAPQQAEVAALFASIGLDEESAPEAVEPAVARYFNALRFDPQILVELDRTLKRVSGADRVETASVTAQAYRRLTEGAQMTAPKVGEEARGGTPAQSLAQSLGVKVRI